MAIKIEGAEQNVAHERIHSGVLGSVCKTGLAPLRELQMGAKVGNVSKVGAPA